MSHQILDLTLLLLLCAVIGVVVFRLLHLPPMLGYLAAGMVIGPHALAWVPDETGTRHLAEFGVVFLMFSIGLEFSLPKLKSMRKQVFGLGFAQVSLTLLITATAGVILAPWLNLNRTTAFWGFFALGGALAMSSTAIVSKMLSERLEIDRPHGQNIFGVLLFQDLAVVPLLILIPALSRPMEELVQVLVLSALKAAAVLALLLFFGQRLTRQWFHIVARRRSQELFMLNLLLMTLGLAWLTELAGLSLALGAFIAGVLIAETEYRYQVEEDIKPFRDVLLGLFFITIGMLLNLSVVLENWGLVLLLLIVPVLFKLVLIAGLAKLFGATPGDALRTGLGLAQAGEFGFVLLNQMGGLAWLTPEFQQIILASMVLSILIAPFMIQHADAIVLRLNPSEWMQQSLELTKIAARSIATEKHIIIAGFGRSGQNLAQLLESEGINYIALDLDPDRVREAAAAGESVVFGDAGRREALVAAGLHRAASLVITFSNTANALKVLHHVRILAPHLPVVVRTHDDSDLEKLRAAGAAEVVPEMFEGSLMLASHALLLLGVPIRRVVQRVRKVRDARYRMLRGYFHGADDAHLDPAEHEQKRLHSVAITPTSPAIGKQLGNLGLNLMGVEVSAIRRHAIRGVDPVPETQIQAGDILVLCGSPEALSIAEQWLLIG